MGPRKTAARLFTDMTVVIWTANLLLDIGLALRRLNLMTQRKTADENGSQRDVFKKELIKIAAASCDLANAIHWFPMENFLWSGKLKQSTVGLFGTISSLLMLKQII